VKLIDFGTVKLATKTVTFTKKAVGTTFYMAPDFFDYNEEDESEKPISNTSKVDVWSIGCMMSEMVSGVYPWSNMTKSENKVEAALIKGSAFPIPKEVVEPYKEMIQRCLKTKCEERCTMEDIMKFLEPIVKK